jgi:hypothetical protein
MSQTSQAPARHMVIDSALLATFCAATLYILGSAFRLVRLEEIGVPFEFVRQWSVEEYTLAGGLFLAGLAPLFFVVDLILVAFPRIRDRIVEALPRLSYRRIVLLVLYVIAGALLMIVPIAKRFAHTNVHYRVVNVTPSAGIANIPVLNMYYVSSTDHDMVFIQKWADPSSALIIIPRDKIAAVVLKRTDMLASGSPP